MDPYQNIYRNHAHRYDRLISAEDTDQHLLPAMERLLAPEGKQILDVGTGTGRIPQLLHSKTGRCYALDLHLGMLKEQARKISPSAGRWHLVQADLRHLPFPDNYFDGVTAGWAIGHFLSWFFEDWPAQVDGGIQEMARVTKSGGALVIIETLGTGSLEPAPPRIRLGNYYNRLEKHWGFVRTTISTDYQFQNLDEAVDLTGFFFGEQMAAKVLQNHWVRLPEWTGIWYKQIS
jgi:ubiquinone/menaquinone biosynthesis C-methylase UbiE